MSELNSSELFLQADGLPSGTVGVVNTAGQNVLDPLRRWCFFLFTFLEDAYLIHYDFTGGLTNYRRSFMRAGMKEHYKQILF